MGWDEVMGEKEAVKGGVIDERGKETRGGEEKLRSAALFKSRRL